MNLAACSCRHKNNPIFVLQLFQGVFCWLCLWICSKSLHCKCRYIRMQGDLAACTEPGDIHSHMKKTLPISHTFMLSHLSALVWQSKEVRKKLLRNSCGIIWTISRERFISVILLQPQGVTSAWTARCLPYSLSKTRKEFKRFMASLFCSCSAFPTWAQNWFTSSNENHAPESWKLHVSHARDPNKKNGRGKLLQTASQPLVLLCCITWHNTANYALKNKSALPAGRCQHLSCPALLF